jgi:hypothetical protein
MVVLESYIKLFIFNVLYEVLTTYVYFSKLETFMMLILGYLAVLNLKMAKS